jgi:hypothetical protein
MSGAQFNVNVQGVTVEKDGSVKLSAQILLNPGQKLDPRDGAMVPSFKLNKEVLKLQLEKGKPPVASGNELLKKELENSTGIRDWTDRNPNLTRQYFGFKEPVNWTVTCEKMKNMSCSVTGIEKLKAK